MNNLYVGKMFELKNIHRIPWSSHNTITRYQRNDSDRQQGSMSLEETGKTVLVVDERTKKVRIITKNKQIVWIAKYYLAKEVYADSSKNNINDTLDACLTKLTKLAGRDDAYDDMKSEIFEIIVSIRNIKDSLGNE